MRVPATNGIHLESLYLHWMLLRGFIENEKEKRRVIQEPLSGPGQPFWGIECTQTGGVPLHELRGRAAFQNGAMVKCLFLFRRRMATAPRATFYVDI